MTLETKHPVVKERLKEYIENFKAQENKQAKNFTNYLKLPEKRLIVSCKVAQLLAKRKKAHTDVASVIAPILTIVVGTIPGPVAAQKVMRVFLSNETVLCRSEDFVVRF